MEGGQHRYQFQDPRRPPIGLDQKADGRGGEAGGEGAGNDGLHAE
jgi:hypothetical protein